MPRIVEYIPEPKARIERKNEQQGVRALLLDVARTGKAQTLQARAMRRQLSQAALQLPEALTMPPGPPVPPGPPGPVPAARRLLSCADVAEIYLARVRAQGGIR